MKIAQIIPAFVLAGAEIMCENLIYAEIEKGHEVIAVSMYDYRSPITERLISRGVDVRFLGKKRGLDLSMVGKMKRLFEDEAVDVVHTHLYAAKYAHVAAKRAGVPVKVHTVHNIAAKESGRLSRIFNRYLFKKRGVIPVALSELVGKTVCEEYRLSSDCVPVVTNGIDLSRCIPKKSYKIADSFKILHVGRFSEQKNHFGLLRAFDIFHKKYPNSELWLIGEGELRDKVRDYAAELGISSSVKLLGAVSSPHSYMNEADIFTLPSLYEGVPMTLIEAMGTGLPIVATAVGGVPDMLDGECAMLSLCEEEQIAEGFEKYYLDEALRHLHGSRAKQKSFAFSSLLMGERYIEIYAGSINARKGAKDTRSPVKKR